MGVKEIKEPEFMGRLRVELLELDKKIVGLNSFLQGIDIDNIIIAREIICFMQIQYASMQTYREALRSRMEIMGMFDSEEAE